jgi:hypothetical protein
MILIPLLSFLARAAGGGWPMNKLPSWAGRFPEIIIALIVAYMAAGVSWWILPVLVWVYFAFETGHGNAYHMGFHKDDFPGRWQTLDYIVRPVAEKLGFENRSAGYCWLFMGLKGLLIGLPLAPYGLALAVLWPLSYYLSFRFTRDSVVAEYLSGACLGLILWLGM